MNKVKKYICEYCGNCFSTEPILKNHKNTALYCLKNRNKTTKFKCKYCFKRYTRKATLTKHLISCKHESRYTTAKRIKAKNVILKRKKFNLVNKNDTLENTIKNLNKTNQKIKKQNVELEECIRFYDDTLKKDNEILKVDVVKYKQKNKDLKKQMIELQKKLAKKEGEVDGIINAPVRNITTTTNKNTNTTTTNKNTTYVNPKLTNINVENIEPLTIERIKKQIADGKFTDKHFEKGVDGIVEFLVPIMTLKRDDGTVERNYVCTDVSRNKFYRLEEGKVWKSDSGGLFIGEAIQGLGPSVNDSYRRLVDKKHKTDNEFAKEMYTKRINKLMPIFRASVHNFNDEFVEVLAKTKNKMKHHISV